MLELKINPLVVSDLKSIRDYIAEDNEEAARKTTAGIFNTFEKIQQFPGIGANLARRVSFKTNYKYVIHKDYIIVYNVQEEFVEIYRVIDRFQDITSILFH